MTSKKFTRIILPFSAFLLLLCTGTAPATEKLSFKEYLDKANSSIKTYRQIEAADALKEATRLGGNKHPSLYMRLATLYYGLGLIPDAIEAAEKGVRLAPSSKWYKYDLAKFYYADKQHEKAEKMFSRLLQLDPGFTYGYYYLARLYFHRGAYDLAWLSLQRAKQLGFQGNQFERSLEPLTSKPAENHRADNKKVLFRFIKISSAEKAREVLNKLSAGSIFENFELKLESKSPVNADFGMMVLSELKESVAALLRNSAPYANPIIIKTGADYRIMQRILPFHPEDWKQLVENSSAHSTKGTTVLSLKAAASQSPASSQSADTAAVKEPASITQHLDATPGNTGSNLAPEATNAPGATTTQSHELFSSKLDAYYALENWKQSWQDQDFAGYLAAYSDNYVPEKGFDRAIWEEKRRNSLQTPDFIKITLEDPVVEMLTPNVLLATFKQTYQSNRYQDTVIKTLTMEKEAKGWKITRERVIKKLN